MLRSLFASLRKQFRKRRYERINNVTDVEIGEGYVLDLGGGPASFFAGAFPRPERLILVDIDYARAHMAHQKRPGIHVVVADGEALPLKRAAVDVTVCNSVIEHVEHPRSLADEIHRVSRRYFVQTPNRRFPMETHSFLGIPFYHSIRWHALQRLLCRIFGANFEYIESVQYLSRDELAQCFPQATIAYESFFGLPKSFYVYYEGMEER